MSRRSELITGIVGASAEALHSIDVAHGKGVKVVAFDGDAHAAGLAAADKSIVVDISEKDKTIAAASSAGVSFLMVAPIGRYLSTIGAVNDALNLPGITGAAADMCTDKWEYHKVLHRKGLRDCSCFLLPGDAAKGDIRLISANGDECGIGSFGSFPAIVKPRFGSGSRGIHVANASEDLRSAVLSAALTKEDYIVEALVPGIEYGADAAIIDGVLHLTLLRKKLLTPLPDRQAVGYFPEWDSCLCDMAESYLQNVVEVMGIDESILHADLILRRDAQSGNRSFFAIEVSARPSGHYLHDVFTPHASGVDLVEEMLHRRLGERASFTPRKKALSIIRYFDFCGTVKYAPDEEEARACVKTYDPRLSITRWNCNISTGDDLPDPSTGHSLMGRGFFIIDGFASSDASNPDVRSELVKKIVGAAEAVRGLFVVS